MPKTSKKEKKNKADKPKREPSAYNIFMKNTLATYKKDNPTIDHKQAFKDVAALWKDSPENPKNKPVATE